MTTRYRVKRFEEVVIHNIPCPHLEHPLFWLPVLLLADLSIRIIDVQPPPLSMSVHIPSQLVQLDLLLPVTAVQELPEFRLALSLVEHTGLLGTFLKDFSGLPALATGYLVGLEGQGVFLHPSDYVETPVVPHGLAGFDDVVGFGVQLGELLDWGEFGFFDSFLSRYINIEKVGQGTYGAVYKSRDTVSKDVSFDLMLRWSL